MDSNIIYIGFSFPHHRNSHAGYQQIKNYLRYNRIIDGQYFFDRYNQLNIGLLDRILRKFSYSILRWAIPISRIYFRCLFLMLGGKPNIFHFIYGENIYYPLNQILSKRNKVACTIHQPYEWFIQNPTYTKYLSGVNKIVLVGNSEYDKFSTLYPKAAIKYIPHGVCTDFYAPDLGIRKEKILLTVGNWLRDYSFANKVYKELLNKDRELNIVVVSNPSNKGYIDTHERITFLSGISDEQLLSLYQKCCVLFLPLIRYTANNSLLEACSVGCNVVISSNHSDNSYIPEKYITLSDMDVDSTVQAILKTMSFDYNTALSDYVKEHYSWEKVAAEVHEFLIS